MSPHTLQDIVRVGRGLDRPECVNPGPDGTLHAGGLQGQVYRLGDDGEAVEIANVGGIILGLCLDADSNVYACNVGDGLVYRISPEGATSVWSAGVDGTRYTVPNYCAFDDDGALWLTDSGAEDPTTPTGRIIRIPPGGGPGEVVSREPLNFPNGLCLDADGEVVFLESFGYGISRLRNGFAEPLVPLPGVTPDGIAVDVDGAFVVSCYYPFRLLSVPAGATSATVLLDDPVGITLKMPTNVAYFGPNHDQLAIALLAGSEILALPMARPGLTLRFPRVGGST